MQSPQCRAQNLEVKFCAAAASARGTCGWDLLSNSPHRRGARIHTDSRLSNCGILTEERLKIKARREFEGCLSNRVWHQPSLRLNEGYGTPFQIPSPDERLPAPTAPLAPFPHRSAAYETEGGKESALYIITAEQLCRLPAGPAALRPLAPLARPPGCTRSPGPRSPCLALATPHPGAGSRPPRLPETPGDLPGGFPRPPPVPGSGPGLGAFHSPHVTGWGAHRKPFARSRGGTQTAVVPVPG